MFDYPLPEDSVSDEVDAEGSIAVSGTEVADEEGEPSIEGLSGEEETEDHYSQPGKQRLTAHMGWR